MDAGLNKTERLIKIWLLLLHSPFRLGTRDLAAKFGVNVKTIYRDMDAPDVELRIPVCKQGTPRGIDEGHFLPFIRFTLPEALTISVAARLMVGFPRRYAATMSTPMGSSCPASATPTLMQGHHIYCGEAEYAFLR